MILYAIAKRKGDDERLFDNLGGWGHPNVGTALYKSAVEARRELLEEVPAKVRAMSYVVRVRVGRSIQILDR